MTNFSNSWVIFKFECGIPLSTSLQIGSQDLLQHFFRIHYHGPKLQAFEGFPTFTNTLMPINGWSAIFFYFSTNIN
ncbi:hypothetical protein BANRA_03852 [Klebsiella variicola]|nr:hypothetical protein BANRA_03852 [Klebsiella variicola]